MVSMTLELGFEAYGTGMVNMTTSLGEDFMGVTDSAIAFQRQKRFPIL